ncbi:hypothetical protein TNCV_4401981 [Trichonephila clavipes]|nr:hypothetical protein TNCV_4401981 [Trichonephila clavipes]
MPLDNKCRIGPLAGAPPDTCAVVINTETESGFIEDDASPVCHTPVPRSAEIQSTLPMMWGRCLYQNVKPREANGQGNGLVAGVPFVRPQYHRRYAV